MIEFFRHWYECSTDTSDYIVLGITWVINLVILSIIYFFVIRPILYKKKYSHIKIDTKVRVLSKEKEVRSSTYYIKSGKVMVPVTTTNTYYYVYLKGDVIDKKIDDRYYYDTLLEGSMVKVKYKEVWQSLRFSSEDKWDLIGIEIKEIVSER